MQTLLDELTSDRIPTAQEDAERLQELLSVAEKNLQELNIAGREFNLEEANLTGDQNSLKKQITQIDQDIANYSDLKRLKKMGSAENLSIAKNECPTCGQNIEDVLYVQGGNYNPLSIEQSIAFLKGQKSTFQALLTDVDRELHQTSESKNKIEKEISELRNEIRTIRSTLISEAQAPSEAAIVKKIELQKEVQSIEIATRNSQFWFDEFRGLCLDWKSLLAEEKQLPKGVHSEEDVKKLSKLQSKFIVLAKKFSITSLTPDDFEISANSYLPMFENFDLGFELSASDVVRMIWAYLTSLMEVGRSMETNHLGLLVFDEPQQQKIKDVNFTELLERLKETSLHGEQAIVAMSEMPSLRDISNINLINFDNWVIQKF